MPIDPELKALMTQTVKITAYSSLTNQGEPVYGAEVSYAAMVQNKDTMFRDREGRERWSNTTIYVNAASGIKPQDKLELPDGTFPKIMRVVQLPDEFGDHHVEIYT
jgi:hypothetical protein